MNGDSLQMFWSFGLFTAMLFIIGFYCILATHNLIRSLIGLELLMKAVTLLMIAVGYVAKCLALIQALVITLIVVEVVVITVAVGVVLGIQNRNDSLDARKIRTLKG